MQGVKQGLKERTHLRAEAECAMVSVPCSSKNPSNVP